jgi:hypothetical protein
MPMIGRGADARARDIVASNKGAAGIMGFRTPHYPGGARDVGASSHEVGARTPGGLTESLLGATAYLREAFPARIVAVICPGLLSRLRLGLIFGSAPRGLWRAFFMPGERPQHGDIPERTGLRAPT